MMEMVCETDSLDRDLQDSITELNIISEQMQIAIAENSRVALDQDEYENAMPNLRQGMKSQKLSMMTSPSR
mgnify:CR=1 FL=1